MMRSISSRISISWTVKIMSSWLLMSRPFVDLLRSRTLDGAVAVEIKAIGRERLRPRLSAQRGAGCRRLSRGYGRQERWARSETSDVADPITTRLHEAKREFGVTRRRT